MESNTQPAGGAPRTSTGLPYVAATQAGALLRSGLAIASELMGNAFNAIGAEALETFASRWYLEPKEQFVQRLLDARMAELKGSFMQRLREHQDTALASLLNRGNAAKIDVHAESLSLLDVVTVSSNTFVTSSANRMRGLVEEPMRDLHLIVNFLSGRQQIRISDDPFGPNVFMQALLAAGEDQALNAEAWEHFLSVFEKPMGEEIARIHVTLLEHFARHGLQPATMRREFVAQQAAQRAASHGRVPAQPGAPNAPNAQALAQANAINDALAGLAGAAAAAGALGPIDAMPVPAGFRFDAPRADPGLVLNNLLRRLQANAHDTPIPASPRQGPPDAGLFSAIGELQQLGLQGLAGATLAAGPDTNISSWREHLVGKSSRTVDKLTIELVGMLFEQVMRDNQVPAEIKALLSRLQFPVLKAALLDADIFTSSTHPARRLIDRIASTSTGWEPYGDENERYRAQVEHVVKEVLQLFDKDLTVFERLLNEFDQFVSDIAPRDADPVARAKRALEEAEKREVLTINTTIQVRRAFEKIELEPYLRDFLVGPWVQVLVSATVRDEQTPGFSKRFREAIHDVVWSVLPKANSEDRKRLTQLIPQLIRVIRDGLALTRTSEHDAQEFLQQLMTSHALAVKPVDQATYIKSSLVSTDVRARIEGIQITGSHPITTVAGGIRVSAHAVRRVAEEFSADMHMPDPVTDIGGLDRVEEAHMEEQIASWQRGTWFSIWDESKQEMIKARLRWISPLRTLFLFSTDQEKSAHVLPPHVLKSYLKRNYIQPIETVPLTKRAVDGVVGAFERVPRFAQDLAAKYMPT